MTTLADIYAVKTRFHRSVDLVHDAGRSDALDGYLLTEQAGAVARRIAEGVITPSHERAWALTGPYGTGKSAFALFLASLLGEGGSPVHAKALSLLRDNPAQGSTVTRLQALYRKRTRGFLVILVSGSRQALVSAILEGTGRAVRQFFAARGRWRSYCDEIDRLTKRSGRAGSESALCDLLRRLSQDVRAAGGAGVLLLVDEFGKFLEFAAANPTQADVFALQRIAEFAVRSGENPVAVVTILHQAFERYAANLPPSTRDEWRKIQGRFQDVAFVEESHQLLTLVGNAIRRRITAPSELLGLGKTVLATGRGIRPFSDHDVETYGKCLPLHPTTAAVLPSVFRSALAQNERSLFSFLATRLDNGFEGFLARTEVREGGDLFYRLDILHDYLKGAMGPALLAASDSKRWAEVEHAIDRVPKNASVVAVRVVKAVGILTLFGTSEMGASREMLAFALEDRAEPSLELSAAIEALERASIIVFRRHRGAYGLWEGSDINVDQRFRLARERVLGSSALLDTVRRRARLHPMVARRHFFLTGTLRFFEADVASLHEIENAASRALYEGDGRIIYLLPSSNDTAADLTLAAQHATDPSRSGRAVILVSVPRNSAEILGAAADLDAWLEVRQMTAELAGDAVARRELAARVLAAEERLDSALGEAFGWGDRDSSTSSSWYRNGQEHRFSPRTLVEELSTVFDEAFSSAPRIHNELLNRRSLSSAAAAARRALIDRMLTEGSAERLGIEGFPPEASMYASVLAEGGLHRRSGERFLFGKPETNASGHFRPVWDAINEFLDTTEGRRRPLGELRSVLAAPPFGVKDGPFPVLLFAVIAAAPNEIALFEDGTFLMDLSGAVVERLLRRIDHFEIARYRLDADRVEVLRQLGCELEIPAAQQQPVEIVRSIVRRVSGLPKYTRSTRRTMASALLVRDAIQAARDPLQLLFFDLPMALGMHSSQRSNGVEAGPGTEYAKRLAAALRGLDAAYPSLLRQIERDIAVALDLGGAGDALRAELAARVSRVAGLATDLRLRAFIGRATEPQLGFNEWLEGLAMVIGNRPPVDWADAEIARFEIGLTEIRALFFRAEGLALDQQGAGTETTGIVELMRVSLAVPGRQEQRQMLRLRPADAPAIDQAEASIRQVLEARFGNRRDAWLAALGRTLQNLLDPGADLSDSSHGPTKAGSQ